MGETIRHPLHSMCSYLGCFPPAVPRRIIDEWVPEGNTILDPFCGSGTTLIEAIQLGHPCFGLDLNPLAVALSTAKVQPVTLEDVLDRIMDLANNYPGQADLDLAPEDLKVIFHRRTLSQLIHIRESLDNSRPEDLFIRGAILGIMHGKFRKGGGTAYLSIDMPNTFSMSAEYVRGFVAKHNLQQPPVDVFAKLRERVAWLLRLGALSQSIPRAVLSGDATNLAEVVSRQRVKIDAIVTSPPYLGVLRYGAFNWIRLWFLGKTPVEVDRTLDVTDSLDRYLSFVASFLLSASKVVDVGSPVILVIGDVVEAGQRLELAARVWEEMEGLIPYAKIWLDVDEFDQATKTTRIWGEARKGRATPLDRVLVLERTESVAEECLMAQTGTICKR
jgi:hypothetical protein